MKRATILACLIGLNSVNFSLAAESPDAEASFAKLRTLAGSWKLTNPKSPTQTAFRISFKPISHDTALVETFGDPAGPVTETIYHLDGEKLMATHYCAQGNQPRLRLQKDSTDTVLHFSFFDITNLKHAEDSHLIDLRFTLSNDGKISREETYLRNGKKDVSTLALEKSR